MSGKALLVMGESDEQRLFNTALARVGLEVSCISATSEAMEQCAAGASFDLLIADLLFDGNGTARAVAEQLQQRCAAIRVLFLSGCSLGQILERGVLDAAAFAGGRVSYLRTPLPLPVLMGKVWGLLEGTPVSLTPTAGAEDRAGALVAASPHTPTAAQPRKATSRESRPSVRVSAGAA